MVNARDRYRLSHSVFSVASLDEQDDEGAYRQTKTPERRRRDLEYLRRMDRGDAAAAGLQRVLSADEPREE